MKTRSTRSLRRLLFKIRFFCDCAEQIGQLEKALARKPEKLQLNGTVDHFLAAAFAKRESGDEADKPGPERKQEKPARKIPNR